jgi:anti-sigma B factor antagonist
MDLQIEHLPNNIDRAIAIGHWDVAGAAEIDLRLSVLSGSGRSIILDMTQVSFLSSMGLRSILMSAKTVALRHARMVLLSPDAHVRSVLTAAGIDTVVPIHHDIVSAVAVVQGPGNPP